MADLDCGDFGSTIGPSEAAPRQMVKAYPCVIYLRGECADFDFLKESIAKGKVGDWAYPVVLAVLFAVAIYINYHERMMAKLRLNRQGGAA